MNSVGIVGTGLAGIRAAEALRSEGFEGRIMIVGDESTAPYDRPPLSKDVLLGKCDLKDISLLDTGAREDLDAEWILGIRAVALDPISKVLTLDDGRALDFDGLVIASGARARRLSGMRDVAGVHTLRTIEDAHRLRDDLSQFRRVVVVGGGFIGAEVASSARSLGNDVTIVESEKTPLLRQLGQVAAEAVSRLHVEHGVRLVTEVSVTAILGEHRVSGVELSDGRILAADVVVVGVGAEPNVEWLRTSGITCDSGVLTDEWCRTDVPYVVAAGDVASYRSRSGSLRIEHWTNARDMPLTAARSLLAEMCGRDAMDGPPYDPLPYVWSDQYGRHLQMAGRPGHGDVLELVSGAFEERWLAVYRHNGEVTGVLGVDTPKEFGHLKRELRSSWARRGTAISSM